MLFKVIHVKIASFLSCCLDEGGDLDLQSKRLLPGVHSLDVGILTLEKGILLFPVVVGVGVAADDAEF